jgi:hypothetical protein
VIQIPADLRNAVRIRAGDCCEYCRIPQRATPFLRLQLEHIIARQHGGQSIESNLAWACQHCNLHKGPNLSGIDPQTELITVLFHPRLQLWTEHFGCAGPRIFGRSAEGRATVDLLNMNTAERLQIRSVFRLEQSDSELF